MDFHISNKENNMSDIYIKNLQTNSTSIIHTSNDLQALIHYIYMIFYPIIFLLGFVGNIFSSLLFSMTELSQTSCGIYFLLLAIFDTFALLSGLHFCFLIGYRITISNVAYCRTRNFLMYTSSDMVSWLIVAVSVDRFIKVKFPMKARIHCTKKLTIIAACLLTTVFILKNVHLATVFIGDYADNAIDHCDPNPKYPQYVAFFKNIWPWIDLTTSVLLPFVIVISCNITIIRDQRKRRLKFGCRSLDRSLIKFLLISSISLIVCNFPLTIVIVVYPYVSANFAQKEVYNVVEFIFDLLRLPSYLSLAFNFYLYYYSSSIFRQQANNLFKRLCRISVKFNRHQIHMVDINRSQSPRPLHVIKKSEEQ